MWEYGGPAGPLGPVARRARMVTLAVFGPERPVQPMTRRPLTRASTRRRLSACLGLVAAAAIALSGSGALGQIDAQRVEVRDLETRLIQVESSASSAANAYAEAERQVEGLRAGIRDNTARLQEMRRTHGVAQRRLSDRLVAIYTERESSFFEILITSGDLSDAVNALEVLQTVSGADRRILRSVKDSRERLATVRTRLISQRAEAETRAGAAEGELRRLNALIVRRRQILGQSRARLSSLVAAEEQRSARLAALRAAQGEGEADLRRQAAGGGSSPASPSGSVSSGSVAEHLAQIAQCESGGDPTAVSASGQYRGKYQFDPQTWRGTGGTGDPAAAPEAEQDRRAAILYARSGWHPWPVCGRR